MTENKVAIVTGTSSGIGLETAIHLAKNGFKTYATMRNTGKSDIIKKRSQDENVPIEILQLDVNDELSVKNAMFSDFLLDIETTEYKYYLMGSNPNRTLEKESAFKIKQEQLFTEALSSCLVQKNMKKCSDEIKIEDFKQKDEPSEFWMP